MNCRYCNMFNPSTYIHYPEIDEIACVKCHHHFTKDVKPKKLEPVITQDVREVGAYLDAVIQEAFKGRKWVDLTNSEIWAIVDSFGDARVGYQEFAGAVIAAFKEKNK